MSKLFGIPVGSLALVLVVVLAVALAGVVALAMRNRVFLRLGVRNVRRRRARAVLIVTGLMLGTAIITVALATGDTMSQTIRSSALSALGKTDEVVAAKGIEAALGVEGGAGTATRFFPQGYADRIDRSAQASGLVAGVAPVIVDSVAMQDLTSRQNEPRVTLFAGDPARLAPFGPIRAGGETVSLADLGPHEVYLNQDGADALDAKAGDTVRILLGSTVETARIKAVVRYSGAATADAGVLMPLERAQTLLGKPGLIAAVFVANKNGTSTTDQVTQALEPTADTLGLEVDKTKQNALETADTVGAAFMSLFTTFGSFSIAAGILLIFLIFVMLAAERRGELGIARAVGTRRRHLVQMFLYEGATYDLAAAVVGAVVGVLVAYGLVLVMASAFETSGDFKITYAVKPASIMLAYALGVLLTLAVVAFSAWRVSRMNIVSAIRNLPDPSIEKAHRRRRLLLAVAGVALGGLLAASGLGGKDAVTLGFGVLLIVLSLVPLLRALGVSERVVHTGAGLALVVWFVLPISTWLFGPLKVNFSMFILGGLAIVIGASWTIVYNADLLLGAVSATLGRIPRLAPVLRMAMAYPLRSLFRTGVTLAMFTLVVFTLVVGATTSGAFTNAFNDIDAFGGGFDVRATVSPTAPVTDMQAALTRTPGVDQADVRVVSSQSSLAIKARQLGTTGGAETYLVHGVDRAFLDHTTYGLATWARGYDSPAQVWHALGEQKGLAVVDQFVVPRKANWSFGVTPDFRLSGFYLEDKNWAPVRVSIRDPQTGKQTTLTVIGVLSDSAPQLMAGIWTSQSTLTPVFGNRVQPTSHLFALTHTAAPKTFATSLESAFLSNGMQADSMHKLLSDAVSASITVNRLIQGFMGLGLIVGVAALGVITARAVVERRQQIGVLRAIGFRRSMVQASFLFESSFIALTAIIVGTGLGLAVAFNVIHDSQQQPSWSNLSFDVPWLNLAIIFLAVYAVALATTLAPARRAARIYPAQALRYQ